MTYSTMRLSTVRTKPREPLGRLRIAGGGSPEKVREELPPEELDDEPEEEEPPDELDDEPEDEPDEEPPEEELLEELLDEDE